VLEGVDGISQLEQVSAREDPPSILQQCRPFFLPLLLLPAASSRCSSALLRA
jgi:hypothetical protein